MLEGPRDFQRLMTNVTRINPVTLLPLGKALYPKKLTLIYFESVNMVGGREHFNVLQGFANRKQ